MVQTLGQRGLIVRERNPRNRRELQIRLTEAGRQLLADHAESVAALDDRMVSKLSPRQVGQLRSALATAYRALVYQYSLDRPRVGLLLRLGLDDLREVSAGPAEGRPLGAGDDRREQVPAGEAKRLLGGLARLDGLGAHRPILPLG